MGKKAAQAEAPATINVIGAGYLRMILMILVTISAFGFPEPTGLVSAISRFSISAFFILSGYFVLVDSRKERILKLRRKIARTLLCFVAMFVFYLLINVIFFMVSRASVAISLRTVFEVVVLNTWPLPIGNGLWFIQAMLYAYVLIYILDKLKLLKFYPVIMVITMIIMVLLGEFSGLIHFSFHGYNFIPGNWLTRAIPYILLGRLLRQKEAVFTKVRAWVYIVLIAVGAALSVTEIFLLLRLGALNYEGHMIGFGIMAFAACALAVSKPNAPGFLLTFYDSAFTGLMYVFLEPVYYLLALVAGLIGYVVGVYALFGSFIAFVVCFMLAFVLRKTVLAKLFFTSQEKRTGKPADPEEVPVDPEWEKKWKMEAVKTPETPEPEQEVNAPDWDAEWVIEVSASDDEPAETSDVNVPDWDAEWDINGSGE